MKGLGRDAWIGAWAKGIFLYSRNRYKLVNTELEV